MSPDILAKGVQDQIVSSAETWFRAWSCMRHLPSDQRSQQQRVETLLLPNRQQLTSDNRLHAIEPNLEDKTLVLPVLWSVVGQFQFGRTEAHVPPVDAGGVYVHEPLKHSSEDRICSMLHTSI